MLENVKDIITNSLSNLTKTVNIIDSRTKITDNNLSDLKSDFNKRMSNAEYRLSSIESELFYLNGKVMDVIETVKFIPKLYENVDKMMSLMLKEDSERIFINSRLDRIEKILKIA